ncbi:MAG: choice-of-anchor J domain-containing protein [Bacteroidales bacterium]|nr:choice-of-anchor J domain-containing protein [Bacteroidales bacterium]
MKRKFLILAALLGFAFGGFSQNKLNEKFENNDTPEGWSWTEGANYGGATDFGVTEQGTIDGQTKAYTCMESQFYFTEEPSWLITPQLNVTQIDDSLVFWFKQTEVYCENMDFFLDILVSTDNNQTTSFDKDNPLLHITFEDNEDFVRYAVSLEDYVGQTIYLAFYFKETEDLLYTYLTNVQGPEIYTPVCAVATGFNVSKITSDGAVLKWDEVDGGLSYTIELLDENQSSWDDAESIPNIIGSEYELTGLLPATNYKARIKTNCGYEQSDYSLYITFSTLSESIITLPYSQTFEGEEDFIEFAYYSTSEVNKWTIGGADGYGTDNDKNSLYISMDNGQSAATTAATTVAYSVIRVNFDDNEEFRIAYKYKISGLGQTWNGGMDFFKVFLLDDDKDIEVNADTNLLQEGAIEVQKNSYNNSLSDFYWENYNKVINNVSNKTMKLVFMWQQSSGASYSPAALVDDIIIEPYVPCEDIDSTIDITLCNGEYYYFKDAVYSQTGNYTYSIPNDEGCDTNFTIHLNILPKFDSTIYLELNDNDTLIFNNKEYATIGTYYDTLMASNGCDSVITLIISVNPCSEPIFDTIYQTICDNSSFEFYGEDLKAAGTYTHLISNSESCDTTIVLFLSIVPTYSEQITAEITQGESYTLNNKTYTMAGTYYDTLTASNGCDSVITLILSVKSGIDDITNNNEIIIYPNPAKDFVVIKNIECSTEYITINIYNTQGKLILSEIKPKATTYTINTTSLPEGVYYVNILSDNQIISRKLIIIH